MKKIKLVIFIVLTSIVCTFTICFANTTQPNEFKLMDLPYSYDALEPYIDKQTMMIHHNKHHKAYVDNLNKTLANYPELASKSLDYLLTNTDSLPKEIKQSVINNGGGVYNHNFYWNIMSPNQTGKPSGNLAIIIDRDFGDFETFKSEFKNSATSRFGSGWAWLVSDKDGKLSIISTANQDTPISIGLTPIIGIDVWEHAYYLKYQNKRADYVDNWWNVVNWNQANKNYNNK